MCIYVEIEIHYVNLRIPTISIQRPDKATCAMPRVDYIILSGVALRSDHAL